MKHLLFILIGFTPSAFAEAYYCKIDERMGLHFDWDKKEYLGTRFVTEETIIKVVDDDQCTELTLFDYERPDNYIKLLDREPDKYGNFYKCLKKTDLGERESTLGDICEFRAERDTYVCDNEVDWLNSSYQFHINGGKYLGMYAPFNTDPIPEDETTKGVRDSLTIEAGKCSRID